MPGIDQTSPKSWLHDDKNSILLATLTAIALAAGSTLLWRVRCPRTAAEPMEALPSSELPISPGEKNLAGGEQMNTQPVNARQIGGTTKSSKSSRSKERRRRGKDPMKELVKASTNTKKAKKQTAAFKSVDDTIPQSAVVVPEIIEHPPPSLDGSTASSSTSRSSSVSILKDQSLLVQDTDTQGSESGDDRTLFTTTITSSVSVPDAQERLYQEGQGHEPPLRASHSETIHLADSHPILSDYTFSSSLTSPPTPSTSTSSSSDKPHDSLSSSSLQPSHSMYPHYTHTSAPSPLSPNPNGNNSWDYDTHAQELGVSSNSNTTYRKPPRFRSKTRGSGTISPIPTSLSYIPPYNTSFSSTSNSPSLVPSESASSSSEILPTFTFPTLNPPPSPPTVPSDSMSTTPPRPNINTNTANHQRPPTPSSLHLSSGSYSASSSPLHTPTPSQSLVASSSTSSSVSVSAQTQLASLRGALEAARMREDKARGEVERLNKECQELRWRWGEDVGTWRRREGELQNHIQVLTQHLQGYASRLASLPQTSHLSNISPHLNGIQHQAYPSAYNVSPIQSSSPVPHSQSPRSHPTSPQQNHSSPLSSFPPYQLPQSQNSHLKHTKPSLTTPNSHLFSIFFPGTGLNGSAAGASVPRSGFSSGSASPVLDGSPLSDRGRRPTRLRTKTATQRSQDGLVSADPNYVGDGDGEGEEEEEEEFSDILADAILKRPESIRGSFKSIRKDSSRDKAHGANVICSGDVMGSSRKGKGKISLNDGGHGDGKGEREEDEDGWIRDSTSVNVSQPIIGDADDERS